MNKLGNGTLVGAWSLAQMKDGEVVTLQGEFWIWPLPEGKYRDDESLQVILDREIRKDTEERKIGRTSERIDDFRVSSFEFQQQ